MTSDLERRLAVSLLLLRLSLELILIALFLLRDEDRLASLGGRNSPVKAAGA